MKLLLVTYIYQPDNGPSASMFALLCEKLVKMGHDVTVIATVPHYPSGFVDKKYQREWLQRSIENGVRVIRVRIPSLDRRKFYKRLLQFLFFQIGASIASISENPDVAIITNPALNKGAAFFSIATIRNKPSIFLVSDVYPDVGFQTGVFRHWSVIHFVKVIEQYCIQHANLVWSFSESFLQRLYQLGAKPERTDVLGAWVDTNFFQPLSRNNAFSKEFGLDHKFVILYAGNLGLSQGLENILLAAKELTSYPEIQFVFVGDGTGRDALMTKAAQLQINNVQFIPFQPWERVPEVMASADITVLSLKTGIGMQSLPSKTFSYLASGKPILAIVDPDSAIWNLIKESQSGICVSFGSPNQIAEAILKMQNDPDQRKRMGENARTWAVQNYSLERAANHILQMAHRAIEIHTLDD